LRLSLTTICPPIKLPTIFISHPRRLV